MLGWFLALSRCHSEFLSAIAFSNSCGVQKEADSMSCFCHVWLLPQTEGQALARPRKKL